jgi:hypothetical protein
MLLKCTQVIVLTAAIIFWGRYMYSMGDFDQWPQMLYGSCFLATGFVLGRRSVGKFSHELQD